MTERLVSVAGRLGCAPVLLGRPALLVADRPVSEIEAAWRDAAPRGCATANVPPEVVDVVLASSTFDSTTAIEEALRAVDSADRERSTAAAHPVHELPSGRLVGWWAPAAASDDPGPGFMAVPRQLTKDGHIWELRLDGSLSTVRDHVLVDEVDTRGPVLRVPGWVGEGMRHGSPSGILIERLAERANRVGIPIWVPNAEVGALPFLQGLPGRIWVDGPAGPG
jgi:hypothetical protein